MVKDDAVYVPALVTRCRGFEDTITGQCALHAHEWNTYGIREAINRPGDRGPERGDRP